MPDKLDLWLVAGVCCRQAVTALAGQDGLTPHQVDSLDALPNPETGSSMAAFLDTQYHVLKQAAGIGWRVIWFNPHEVFAPEEMPAQDGDLVDLSRLPTIPPALARKPSLADCLDLWKQWSVPDNVQRHSRRVAQSAYQLGVMLRRAGIPVDPILAQRGGLLHDIDKIRTLDQSGEHGQVGADFLEKQGYPAVAEIVREHIMSAILDPSAADSGWEVKLVYYCDKLVEGDQLVPFEKRLAALYKRYPQYRETMARAANPVRALGEQICSILSIPNQENLIFTLNKLQNN